MKVVEYLYDRFPKTEEERRGFVGGFFDCEGSCWQRNGKRWEIEFSNSSKDLLELVAQGLKDWNFLFGISAGHNKQMGRTLYNLRLRCLARVGRVLSSTEIKAKWEAEAQRFFDVFRPRIRRKYGSYELRWQLQELSVSDIVPLCHEDLVVISGGEPLQQNLDNLIEALQNAGHVVQIETSGAFDFKGNARPNILVCSPKPRVQYRIRPTVMERATIFKLVDGPVGSGFDWNDRLAQTLKETGIPVYVMPHGGPPARRSIEHAIDIANQWGFSLSPRLHYQLGVR